MWELDKTVVSELVTRGVENTGWTLYRDDGWIILPSGTDDVPVGNTILHCNIVFRYNISS